MMGDDLAGIRVDIAVTRWQNFTGEQATRVDGTEICGVIERKANAA